MSALLRVEQLSAGYGSSRVLFDVDLTIAEGQVATLLGRNGMGKSTLVKCLCGWIKPSAGRITFAGHDVTSAPAHRIGQLGLGLVPEGRLIFPTLTVRENLLATASTVNGTAWHLDRVIALFPRLGERLGQLGGTLSGGEQQMLAIGRALMTNPRLLILDEATEGLAPLVRADIWRALQSLKTEKLAMLVIDKDLGALLPLADHHTALEKGRVALSGTSDELRLQDAKLHALIGV
ncbi:MAG: ABC transporter ATP-binding protein [Betaproteobacteria bacterium]|nr:MAG: ABC transporter ATP-binding protein [Betaproteobacteria bacterium]